MTTQIDHFFEHDVAALTAELREVERSIPSDAEPEPGDSLDRVTEAITRALEGCAELEASIGDDAEQLKAVQTRFREAIGPWFNQSWFMERALTKPRGYPGDYVLLSAIYDNVPRSRGLGGILDLYFLDQTLAHGVRTRLAGVRRFLSEELRRRQSPLSVLNVACGPAREYADGFSCDGYPVHLTCVDMDQLALDYVQEHVADRPEVEIDIECVHYNALRMASSKSTIAQFGRSDVIYSVGLCDYIPDEFMIRILRGWRESLAPEGVVYVAFKDRHLYNKAVYQWLVDWHFYERDEEHCRRLYEEAGYDMDSLQVCRDDDGVIMNFIARVAQEAVLTVPRGRVDQPEVPAAVRGRVASPNQYQQVHR